MPKGILKFGVKKASHRLTSFLGKANSSFIVNGLYEQGTTEQFSLWAKFLSCRGLPIRTNLSVVFKVI